MSRSVEAAAATTHDVLVAAALLSTAPGSLGGVCLKSQPGPAWDRWLAAFAALLPEAERPARLPPNTQAAQLQGGIDLAATLATGRPVRQTGFLEAHRGRVLLLSGAEPWTVAGAARLIAACEGGGEPAMQHGLPCLVVRDESLDDDAGPVGLLTERLAFRVDLSGLRQDDLAMPSDWPQRVRAAREKLSRVKVPDAVMTSLIACAAALGIVSSRADRFAIEVARVHAAWRGATEAADEDAAVAARLVLAPRARQLPAPDDAEAPDAEAHDGENAPEPDASDESSQQDDDRPEDPRAEAERLVAAAAAALPPGLLAELQAGRQPPRAAASAVGRARGNKRPARTGRPIGHRPGDPRRDGPLHLLATIAAAAPWQAVRRRLYRRDGAARDDRRRLIVLPSDLRVKRFKHHAPSTVIFAVDASGSSALHRMGEAKGAIELLLAECYVRREKVAVVAFHGPRAETLLPPTRALARARRALSGLPGGGPTPLASGLDAALAIAIAERRGGQDCLIVLLTDGRANIDLAGKADRRTAIADALSAARRLAAEDVPSLVVDTSPTPSPRAAEVATAMRARYAPLPHADARRIATAVRSGIGSEVAEPVRGHARTRP